MNANLGMVYGFDDVRGYESLIPRGYVEFMQSFAPQNQLAFNRVAPLWTTEDYVASLEAPPLDALNVRYLMTYADQEVNAVGWVLAYEDAAVRIYENAEALGASAIANTHDIRITYVTAREMLIDLTTDQPETSFVFSTSYDRDWRAFVRPQGAGEDAETQITIDAVADALLTLRIPEPGDWTLRLVYSPTSVQVGAFASFIGGVLLLVVVGSWAWRRYVPPDEQQGAAGRVARNSLVPILLNLFNRGIDFAFAAIMLRLLGPELSGWYYYAIVLFGWFDILTNFGLNLFVTREVARDRSQARRMLVNTSALRLALAGVGVPLLAAFLWVRLSDTSSPVPTEALIAIVVLYVGLLPNSLSTGLTALYYAFERAEIPAAVTTIATICKAVFGVAVLLAGWSIVGLAAASIITNVITLAVLAWNGRGLMGAAENARTRHASSLQDGDTARGDDARAVPSPTPPHRNGEGQGVEMRGLDLPLIRSMVGQSAPLMLNHFLATIFFKIDIILIEAIHTATMVGQYSVAYKWVEALNVIPSFFTQALLPMLSRQAHEDRAAFLRNYRLGIKLLFMLALPVAVVFTVLAYGMTNLLGGAQFLPDGAIALQLMIWSIPIGWMNSLTQYALIALDLQRRITWAFVAGVGFNIITNLLFIPQYGYRAAALTTIASEGVLFVAFAWLLHREIGQRDWLSLVWKPVAAGAAMLLALWGGWSVVTAGITYVSILIWLRPFSPEESERLMPILPPPLRRLVMRVA
jgi:O-antigen/teichoic acid export membrane protein